MFPRKSSHNRLSPSPRSKSSSTSGQGRREPPRHPQGSSASSKHTPNNSTSRPSHTKTIVLSDSDDEPPSRKAAPPEKKASTPLVIEIEDDSDEEPSPNQPRETTRLNPRASLPPRDPISSTQTATPPLPLPRGEPKASAKPPRPPVWDPNKADYGPPTFQHGNSARAERPIAPPTTQPPGFWNTKRPQPESPRAPPVQGQPQKPQPQTPATSQAHVSREPQPQGSQSDRSQPQKGQPWPSDGIFAGPSPIVSSTRSPSTATTSSFPTAFKHYSTPISQNDQPVASLNEDFSSPAPTAIKQPDNANSSTCNNCIQGRLQCDGAKSACAQCTARGVTCAYGAEIQSSTKSKLLVRLKVTSPTEVPVLGNSKSIHSGNESASITSPQSQLAGHDQASIVAPDSVPARKPKIVLRAPHPPVSVPKDQVGVTDQDKRQSGVARDQVPDAADSESSVSVDYQHIDHASLSSEMSVHPRKSVDIDSTLEACTKLLEGLRMELHGWQESSTQAELRQATVDTKTQSGPEIDRTLPDPFKAVTVERRSTGNDQQERPKNKKLFAIRAVPSSFLTGAVLLPKYQAIGRVSSSVLAPNYKTAKYWAYSAEDENDPDLDRKYKDFTNHYSIDFNSLKAQRQCQELVWLWKPWVEEAFSRLQVRNTDVLYFFTFSHFEPSRATKFGSDQLGACRKCGLADLESRRKFFSSDTFTALPHPDDQILASTAILARAFQDMTGISLWHIAAGGLLQPHYGEKQDSTARKSNLCLICFRHCCPDHGSFEDPKEEFDPRMGEPLINNSEQDCNIRRFVSLPDVERRDDNKKHQCGAFCVQASLSLRQILGRQGDGTIDGDVRPPKARVRSVLTDDQLCSESCFWNVNNRRDVKASEVKFQPFLSASQKVLVEKLIPFYLNNPRGPCLISRVIKDVDCLMVFNHMIFTIFDPPHPDQASGGISDSSAGQRGSTLAGKKRRVVPVIDTTRSADLGSRPPFLPCSHKGPCHSSSACSCASSKVHCENFCGCDDSCKRRFRGCTCKAGGRKTCFEDSRCECWGNSRECDPHVCGKCGVIEVLDSSNKYKDEIRIGRCRNNRIQLGLPAPTTKAPSQVQGYGLYSRAEIAVGDFIGEYTGEIISRSEGNRRGTIYHLINQEYLFNLNQNQEIDASKNGNKMRFMNNSQREENINVEAKSLFCSGVVRIGLFAKRDIGTGVELLWKYGYSAELVKFFWEPGERPATARALIPYSNERLARNTGKNKLAGEFSGTPRAASSRSPAVHRKQKRKRPLVESPGQTRDGTTEDSSEEGVVGDTADDVPKPPEIDDSEDSDYYETNGHVSEDAEHDEEDLDEDFDLEPPQQSRGRTSGESGARKGGRSTLTNGTSSSSRSIGGSTSQPRKYTADKGVKKTSRDGMDSRRRQIKPGDKRLGGRAQQRAWETRKQNNLGAQVPSTPK